jgi:hypothetical protein
VNVRGEDPERHHDCHHDTQATIAARRNHKSRRLSASSNPIDCATAIEAGTKSSTAGSQIPSVAQAATIRLTGRQGFAVHQRQTARTR